MKLIKTVFLLLSLFALPAIASAQDDTLSQHAGLIEQLKQAYLTFKESSGASDPKTIEAWAGSRSPNSPNYIVPHEEIGE